MTGGDAIVQSLLRHGVDTVFGVPGVQTYALFDALARTPEIRVTVPRHEQACAYMAFGYADSTGNVGVYSVVPGPGVLNSSAALCTAYGASTALVCLTAEIPSEVHRRRQGAFARAARPAGHPAHADEVGGQDRPPRRRACDWWPRRSVQATSGRPRPVALEMPWDVLDRTRRSSSAAPAPSPQYPARTPAAIDAAVELLVSSANPMIMVGGGAVDAGPEVRELAEHPAGAGGSVPQRARHRRRRLLSRLHVRLGLPPVAETGRPRRDRLAPRAAVVPLGGGGPAAGDRQRRHRPRAGRPPRARRRDRRRRRRSGAGAAGRSPQPRARRALAPGRVRGGARRRPPREIQKVTPHVQYLEAIRERSRATASSWRRSVRPASPPTSASRSTSRERSSPAATRERSASGSRRRSASRSGKPDRAVVSITGDGGFQFGLQELATAAQYDLAVVTVLFNNNAYGNVLRDQQLRYGGSVIGAELRNPDFGALAASYGIAARHADTPDELDAAVASALGRRRAGPDRGADRAGQRGVTVGVPDACCCQLTFFGARQRADHHGGSPCPER